MRCNINGEMEIYDRWYLVYESCERRVFLSLSLKFVFNVLFFQDPVGGLFRGKLIIFSIKKFLRMKREKRERAFFICPLFAAFHHAFPLLFPPFFSFFFLFFFFYILSIDPPSALKHIKAFFTSQYVCIESRKYGGCVSGGGGVKLDLLVGRCAPCIHTWNARPK